MDKALDILLHADQHLGTLVSQYGPWIYAILFLIIFCETGLVFLPILPGDSLLLAIGALAGAEVLNIYIAIPLLIVASSLGSNTNYWIGRWIGPRAFHFPKSFLFNPEHLHKAHAFYNKYGAGMMVFIRFVPFVRTFGPFTAGVGSMDYRKYVVYDSIGSVAWVTSITLLGYLVGDHLFAS
jgi:membrane-associated protein